MSILPRTEADYIKEPDVMYQIDLSEREVRRLGERRYIYPRRLKIGLWSLGPGVVINMVGSTVQHPSDTAVRVFGYVLLVTIIAGIATVTYFWKRSNTEGKKFLEEQKIKKGGNS